MKPKIFIVNETEKPDVSNLPEVAVAEISNLRGWWDAKDEAWRCYICDYELTNEQDCNKCSQYMGYL